jgi:hypothetical protein
MIALRRRIALLICPELSASREVAVDQIATEELPAKRAASSQLGGSASNTLVMLAEVYAGHSGLTLSTVSTYARNDGKFFGKLKSGDAGCTLKTAEHVISWFHANWPADLEWPDSVPRPAASEDAA